MSATLSRDATRRRQCLARHVRQVCTLGDRVVFELVDEIARETGCPLTVERIAEKFAGINPNVLRAVGGDRFPPSPLRVIGGRA